MEDIPCRPTSVSIFKAYGAQVKKKYPWYPQEWCNDWPHQASALTLGESIVLKYAVSYPLRAGLNSPEDPNIDFPELTKFIPFEDGLHIGNKVVEELFVSRGVCVVSHGPLSGPSFLKGLYRPLISYGAGVGISEVVKTKFPNPIFGSDSPDGRNDNESYICLAERGGISIYAENSAENHVSHLPEFQIGSVKPCKFGLLVIPSKLKKDPSLDSKNIFILTHPIKQVSKIWMKIRPAADYSEYDSSEERLVWCEEDICIFWSLKNDKIFIRRLVTLDKAEILHLSTLNASMHQSSPDLSKGFHPSGHFPGTSPLSKQPFTRSAAMKANRDAGAFPHFPSFDFGSSNSSSSSMGHGFYPPHVCIYDDPEVSLKQLFQIDLPKTSWKEPKKFKLVRDTPGRIALWFLLKNNLHSYGIDIESGIKLGNYNIKNVEDFGVPVGIGPVKMPFVVLLDSSGKLSLGWLDGNFSLVCTSSLELSNQLPVELTDSRISSVDGMLFGDTIICTIRKPVTSTSLNGREIKETSFQEEFVKVELKNYRKSFLVRNCMDKLMTEFDSPIVTKLLARLIAINNTNSESNDDRMDTDCHYLDEACDEFYAAICSVVSSEPLSVQLSLGKRFIKSIATFKETSIISTFFDIHLRDLDSLLKNLSNFMYSRFPGGELQQEIHPVLPTFGYLLYQQSPSSLPVYESLPEVLQILLDSPDSFRNIRRLVTLERNEMFIPLIKLLIADVRHRNSGIVQASDPLGILEATGRIDYLSGRDTTSLVKSMREFWVTDTKKEILPINDDVNEDTTWMNLVLNHRMFSEDRRLEEVCRLLNSSSPLLIDTEQRAEMSDHEFVEEQEKHLLQLLQITFAAPLGRAAFTLRTDDTPYTSLTSSILIPKLSLAGKCRGKGTAIELSETDLPVTLTQWPQFHNAVGAALSVRFAEPPADAWFAFNKAKITEGTEQAGMVLGFGLNRILCSMPPTLRHEYLSKENSFTTMSMLLGLAANLAGTGDMGAWKLISLHIGAMLPACTTELDIPRLATLVAPASLGLLFLGTQNSYVAKVLLGEMSKKFTPLSCFGSSSNNNSTSVANPHENTGTTTDREAHSLCAGLGLGFVNLAKGRLRTTGFADDDFDGILRRFVVGGPKPAHAFGEEGDGYSNPAEQTLPSMWEEYRCCHIEEGDNVNVDVTTPSAIIAVALTYLRTGNEAVLNWLSPPGTLHLLDGVRPDLLMLRSLASILVFEELECPEVGWLERTLMPKTLLHNALEIPTEFTRINHESINQCWASIVCGFCLGLGIRYAGTSDSTVKKSIRHYIDLLLKLSSKESNLSEFFPKNFLESCICNLVLASSLVVAGTGELSILRLCRYLQRKVSQSPATASSTTYGLEMCISMATGILFLGGGRYSLSNDDKSIAVLLASVFPKWPINANDNRYHLQALRHLYVLACQPRLILPKPMPLGRPELLFEIEFLDGRVHKVPAPILLPPFYLIRKIRMDHHEYFPIEFNLPKDLPYLTRVVENRGILNLAPRPILGANYGFVREMLWRKNSKFHPMFAIDDLTPQGEIEKINEFNLVHQLGEWCGMKEIVSPVLKLLNADPSDENITWQIRILHWWVETSKVTSFPADFLTLLRSSRKNKGIDITRPAENSKPPLHIISV